MQITTTQMPYIATLNIENTVAIAKFSGKDLKTSTFVEQLRSVYRQLNHHIEQTNGESEFNKLSRLYRLYDFTDAYLVYRYIPLLFAEENRYRQRIPQPIYGICSLILSNPTMREDISAIQELYPECQVAVFRTIDEGLSYILSLQLHDKYHK